VEAGFAEPDVLIITRHRRQSFDVSIVPAGRFDGHFRRSLGHIMQFFVQALVCARHVAGRPVGLAVVELPEQ
jgi:hypothetical protein